MGLNNFTKTRGFKNFMAKLYGWGASVVILGALFKINHYQGADIMLIVGLGTEAIIFFFSAFEPPYVEPDWSLVYPELAGLYHKPEKAKEIMKGKPIHELDNMLKDANIEKDMINRLGDGLRKLGDTATQLGEISEASAVTNEYLASVKNASVSVNELNDNYKKTSEVMAEDAEVATEYAESVRKASAGASGLSEAYAKASESISEDMANTNEFATSIKGATESAKNLTEKYTQTADMLAKSTESLDFSSIESKAFNEQLKKISDNLAALNTVYELQLQNSNQQVESSGKLQETINAFLENLGNSSEKTLGYQEQLSLLTDKVNALNAAYENELQTTNRQVESSGKLEKAVNAFLSNLNNSSEKTMQYMDQLDTLTERMSNLNKVYGNMLSAMSVNPNNS